VARHLHTEEQPYRILTPYDAQRTLIENELKETEDQLPWADTVFNVDAFQGESDCLREWQSH
jgi:superfamily I DNA and/or RNA helicase